MSPDPGVPDGADRDPFDRQAGPQEQDVGLFLDGGVEQFAETVDRDHDVDTEEPGRLPAGCLDLPSKGADVRGRGVVVIVGLGHADGVRGDDADAAFSGDRGGQVGKRDPDAHSALDDGHGGFFVSDPDAG
jgi:hypothetical protein